MYAKIWKIYQVNQVHDWDKTIFHGKNFFLMKQREGQFNKYLSWVSGTLVLTKGEVKTLTHAGYVFPDNVPTKPSSQKQLKKVDKSLLFCQAHYPLFEPGKEEGGQFKPITKYSEHSD